MAQSSQPSSLSLGLQFIKVYLSIEYTLTKCFNNFVQSVVDAQREGDENPHSGLMDQIMDRSRLTTNEYLGNEKTHKAINENFFERLNIVGKDFYTVELLKSTFEHRESIIVGFFIFQNAKDRMLKLYYNFFQKCCDEKNFEEGEMDTVSLYLSIAEYNLNGCILPEKTTQWTLIRPNERRFHS